MRKLVTIIVYTVILLIVGRNLSFLPQFSRPVEKGGEATALKNKVSQVITPQKGNYGVMYVDLKTNQSFGINQKMITTAASVNKVPIIAVLYYLENQGKVDFNQQITLQKEDVQDYGTGSLRYAELGTTYSIKTLIKLTLKQSDNTAAHILANSIGVDVIQKQINDWGLTQTNMEKNETSAADMALLFQKIYANQITTAGKTQEFLNFMTQTETEDRLPALLPEGTLVQHKTGDGIGFLHDVGIITKADHVFFIGVLVSDIGSAEKETKDTLAGIAKTIYDSY